MIEQWLGYTLQDVILFSSETYWRLFERHNTSLWPLPVISQAAGAGLAVAIVLGQRWAGLTAFLALGLAWGSIAHAFLANLYEPINWAVAYVTPLFWFQAALMVIFAPRLTFGNGGARPVIAVALAAVSLAYPVAGLIDGRPIAQSEVLGMAPDPTAVATLAILTLATPGWCRLLLSLLPAAWLAVSATTLLAMNLATGWLPLAALGLAIAAQILPMSKSRRQQV